MTREKDQLLRMEVQEHAEAEMDELRQVEQVRLMLRAGVRHDACGEIGAYEFSERAKIVHATASFMRARVGTAL